MMLERYFKIIEGKALPGFKIARRVACDRSLSAPLKELVEKHAYLAEEFLRIVKKSDNGEMIPEAPRSLLDLKIELASRYFSSCKLCARECGVDRKKEKGACGVGDARIAKLFKSREGESCFVPSVTLLFSGCNFHCAFCNAWDISQFPTHGKEIRAEKLAGEIGEFKEIKGLFISGGEPIPNLHFVLELLGSIEKDIPIILDSALYASHEGMALLDGIIDVYVADLKFGEDSCAKRLAGVENYFEVVSKNLMLIPDDSLVIRHLVLPGHFDCCTKKVLDWISEKKPLAGVSLRGDYRPAYKAILHKEIANRIQITEFKKAQDYAEGLGLKLL